MPVPNLISGVYSVLALSSAPCNAFISIWFFCFLAIFKAALSICLGLNLIPWTSNLFNISTIASILPKALDASNTLASFWVCKSFIWIFISLIFCLYVGSFVSRFLFCNLNDCISSSTFAVSKSASFCCCVKFSNSWSFRWFKGGTLRLSTKVLVLTVIGSYGMPWSIISCIRCLPLLMLGLSLTGVKSLLCVSIKSLPFFPL